MTTYVRSASRALPALWCVGVLASGCGADGPPPEPLAVSAAKAEDASEHPVEDACPKDKCTSQDIEGNGRAFTIFLLGKQESGTFVATSGKPVDWRVRVTKKADGKTPGASNVGVVLLTGPAGMTAKTTAPGETALGWVAKLIDGGKTSLLFGAWDRDACAKVESADACARPASPDKLREYLARFGLTFAVGWRAAGQAGSGGSSATGNVPGAGTPGADPAQPSPDAHAGGPTGSGPTPTATPTPAPTTAPTPTPSSTPTSTPGTGPVHTLYVSVKDGNDAFIPGASVHVLYAPPGGVVFSQTKVAGSTSVAFPGTPDDALEVTVTAAGYQSVNSMRIAASTAAVRAVDIRLSPSAPPPAGTATALWSCRVCTEAAPNAFGRGVYYFDLTIRAANADAALAAAKAQKASCPKSGPAPFAFAGSGACPEICRATGSAFPEYPIVGAVFPAEGKCNSY